MIYKEDPETIILLEKLSKVCNNDKKKEYQWLHTKNAALDNKSPAEVMQEKGFEGTKIINNLLDEIIAGFVY